jgi:hypothetical protein
MNKSSISLTASTYRSFLAVALLASAAAALAGGVTSAFAQDADPPGRVARLGYIRGTVSVQPAGIGDWAEATVNRPLTGGDKVWTDKASRAELDTGSTVLRLNENTGFSFLDLGDETMQIELTTGTVNLHVRELDEHETIEVDTPNVAVSLLEPGDYRIEVNTAGDTSVVSTREGEAEITGNGQSFSVHPQQSGTFVGSAPLSADIRLMGVPDDFDRWCMDRDGRGNNSRSSQYVSRDVIGSQDLDEYGEWSSEPDYGPVWVPTHVEEGWAPYRNGHWVWVAPWGWTWVDQAPWGFAPFHYGRWVSGRRGWCWVPGPMVRRPVYAPALVAWVGGPNLSASIAVSGTPGVAWFPLGPREVYVPYYHSSPRYINRVNVTNTTVDNGRIVNVYNNSTVKYINQGNPRAITAVSRNTFVSALPVGKNLRSVDAHELSIGRASTRDMRVVPDRESVLGGVQRNQIARPPAAIRDRSVVARTIPPQPAVSFDRTQQLLRANGGRPLAPADTRRFQAPEQVPRGEPRHVAAPKTYQPANPAAVQNSSPLPGTPGVQTERPNAASGSAGAPDAARSNMERLNTRSWSTERFNTERGMQQPNVQRPVAPQSFERPAPMEHPAVIERPPAFRNDRPPSIPAAAVPSAGRTMKPAARPESIQRPPPPAEVHQGRNEAPRPTPRNEPEQQQQRSNPR